MLMSINNEIQQDTFSSEYHKLRVNILHSSSWLGGKIRNFLTPFGITQKQFNILRILRGQPEDSIGLTIQDIRSKMIDKRSDTSRLVDRLIKKKFINKRPCAADKRHARVSITENGLALLDTIDKQMKNLDNILDNLSPQEALQLNHLLDKMRDQL